MTDAAPSGGVQSVARMLDVLEVVAKAGGQMALSEIASASGVPLPTVYRLARTLVDRGYMQQLPSRRYALGSRLIPLGEVAGAMLGTSARPVLEGLVAELGESANLAALDRDRVVYLGQVPSTHSMRMFTEVGRRVHLHSTGVGKAVLSLLPDDDVRTLMARTGMPPQTPHTITDVERLIAALEPIRRDGYAIDEGEQEVGVRCVAVPVVGADSCMAVSISGPAPRMTSELIERAIPTLTKASGVLAVKLADRPSA
ncbi:transcriptional regulator, IclR family [Modestobacter sp. DSM 44400]|uniref:IclR family transcriptional regulator n=1 Tax=Modestobacter sp. DSM 44400 TaxID=1550230 RepID=UPI0008947677|nr:IclR family transcriptional regulator [Modestobacter sp. DSM 44400]SDY98283.1 transcriptional regulator, IclR family [Modestobacter sp. DSM 44400]